eukprot:6174154-Pleurochrysis_carterae.AAC.1
MRVRECVRACVVGRACTVAPFGMRLATCAPMFMWSCESGASLVGMAMERSAITAAEILLTWSSPSPCVRGTCGLTSAMTVDATSHAAAVTSTLVPREQ